MFYVSETCDNKFMVGYWDNETNYFMGGQGSYNVVGARILGLTYPEYLRYCRDELGATLRGYEGYSYAVFDSEKTAKILVKNLNERFSEIIIKLKKVDFFEKL